MKYDYNTDFATVKEAAMNLPDSVMARIGKDHLDGDLASYHLGPFSKMTAEEYHAFFSAVLNALNEAERKEAKPTDLRKFFEDNEDELLSYAHWMGSMKQETFKTEEELHAKYTRTL